MHLQSAQLVLLYFHNNSWEHFLNAGQLNIYCRNIHIQYIFLYKIIISTIAIIKKLLHSYCYTFKHGEELKNSDKIVTTKSDLHCKGNLMHFSRTYFGPFMEICGFGLVFFFKYFFIYFSILTKIKE